MPNFITATSFQQQHKKLLTPSCSGPDSETPLFAVFFLGGWMWEETGQPQPCREAAGWPDWQRRKTRRGSSFLAIVSEPHEQGWMDLLLARRRMTRRMLRRRRCRASWRTRWCPPRRSPECSRGPGCSWWPRGGCQSCAASRTGPCSAPGGGYAHAARRTPCWSHPAASALYNTHTHGEIK